MPTWIVLIEGIAAAEVRAVGKQLGTALQAHFPRNNTAIYQLEFTRLKTPDSAG